MELKEMNLEEVEARLAEIDSAVETTESKEEVEALREEMRSLKERKTELKALEERKKAAAELNNGAIGTIIEAKKEERKTMDVKEFRNTPQYIDAYAEYIKTGKAEECRALLTQNVGEAGTIAVPDLVYDIVKTAWEKSDILSLVKKIEVAGNLKVQFEISGTDAVIHTEGSGAVTEEELSLGVVTLIPESIKKLVRISDEVKDMRGVAFLNYIYDEITYKILNKVKSSLIAKIAALNTTASATAPYAKKVKAGAALGTIAQALGQLSDEATNPVIVMNPATWAAFKANVYSGNFNADPFEGLQVIKTTALPAITAASENEVYAIVGDFGMGALANFPNGQGVQVKFDETTEMDEDMIRILGRLYVAAEPIACGAFVNITAPAAG